jgi:hypothetical protein
VATIDLPDLRAPYASSTCPSSAPRPPGWVSRSSQASHSPPINGPRGRASPDLRPPAVSRRGARTRPDHVAIDLYLPAGIGRQRESSAETRAHRAATGRSSGAPSARPAERVPAILSRWLFPSSTGTCASSDVSSSTSLIGAWCSTPTSSGCKSLISTSAMGPSLGTGQLPPSPSTLTLPAWPGSAASASSTPIFTV